MSEFNPVKGTRDFYGQEAHALKEIENVFRAIASLFGYEEMETPILESYNLFARGAGEGSDVVRKEMYDFLDKGGRRLVLRPEFTAGIMRSIVSNKLYASPDLPLRYFYAGPAFRYERPQLGRYREFHQFGVEAVGEDSIALDVETLALALTAFSYLGFKDLKVIVNSLGDDASRENYKKALLSYYEDKVENMCEDCKERYRLNPLRMLDCKVEEDHALALKAPKLSDYLSSASKERFAATKKMLDQLHIAYEEDSSLVRGLDYYSEFIYEIHALSPSKKDYGALGGGGHYGGLLKEVGGPDYPGVGFAVGAERILSLLKEIKGDEKYSSIDVILLPIGEEVLPFAQSLAYQIRALGYAVETPLKTSKLSSLFKKAERKGAKVAFIFGEEEVEKGLLQMKDLQKGEQKEIRFEDLEKECDAFFAKEEEE